MRGVLTFGIAPLLMVTFVAGCSAHGDYCDVVESAQPELLDFGTRSTEAYTQYATLTKQIAAEAPEDIVAAWTSISEATAAVVAVQEETGIDLADMREASEVTKLSTEQVAALNKVYEDFNDTQEARTAVVADVDERCGIDLTKKEK